MLGNELRRQYRHQPSHGNLGDYQYAGFAQYSPGGPQVDGGTNTEEPDGQDGDSPCDDTLGESAIIFGGARGECIERGAQQQGDQHDPAWDLVQRLLDFHTYLICYKTELLKF
ncbi:hypothetical protein D3C81_700030 [compost metagenome]